MISTNYVFPRIIKASEEKALIWDQTYWKLFSLYLAYFTDLNAIQKTKSFCTMCVRRQRLGVNVHLVYELINRKLLPALRLGSLKVRKSTLIDFVERYEGMDLSDLDNIKELQQNMN